VNILTIEKPNGVFVSENPGGRGQRREQRSAVRNQEFMATKPLKIIPARDPKQCKNEMHCMCDRSM